MDAKTPILIAALLAGLAVSPARAQTLVPGAANAAESFAALDTDRDGALSPTELHAPMAARFAAADADGSGTLTPEEMRTMMGGAMTQRIGWVLARMDADADGALSLAELQTPRSRTFGRIDANGDGALSLAEFDAAAERGPFARFGLGPGRN